MRNRKGEIDRGLGSVVVILPLFWMALILYATVSVVGFLGVFLHKGR